MRNPWPSVSPRARATYQAVAIDRSVSPNPTSGGSRRLPASCRAGFSDTDSKIRQGIATLTTTLNNASSPAWLIRFIRRRPTPSAIAPNTGRSISRSSE